MRCYRHEDRDAVAICSHCGKATCAECSQDTGQGIACSSSCAHEIADSYLLKERMRQSFGVGAKPPMPASVVTYALFGLILLVVAIYMTYTRTGIDYLTFAMSAAFFVMAGVSWKRYRDTCTSC
jgi:hypothetical protein